MASENGSPVFEVPSQKTTANAVVIQERTSASKEVTRTTVPCHGARLSNLTRTENVRDSSQTRCNEGTYITAPSVVDTLVKDVPARPSNKAALPSISVQKSRFVVSSDNGTHISSGVSRASDTFDHTSFFRQHSTSARRR